MEGPNGQEDDRPSDERRRRLLAYASLAVLGTSGAAGAWTLSRSESPSEPDPTPPETSPSETESEDPTDEIPALVKRYAPDLYFGALEKWYPTDPRQYVVETEDGPVVDGFTALEAYSKAFTETREPPEPVVFYRVVEVAPGIDAIQYWFYSVFDQFTVNFHWHDWELVQVFIARETGSPLLLSASAHSRSSPNNEYLDPDLPERRRPAILSEVGSHSSASEVNGVLPSFERLSSDSWGSDVTNDLIDVTQSVTAPFAYGLPRDEGARLPFVMPELDGYRLDQHPDLEIDREDFIDGRVTVDSWNGVPRPPESIPLREPGLVFAEADSRVSADVTYRLEPIEAVRESVDSFVGPQLSFQFVIPGFVEDRLASHITSVEIPWEQDRFTEPLADVTDPGHRRRIDGTTPTGLSNRVVGRVRYLGSGADGALDRVADESRSVLEPAIGVSLYRLPVEIAVRLASEDPESTVTRDGVFGYLHVEPGHHLLALNGPGFAPVGHRFTHDGGRFRVGADGELTVVAAADTGWIRGDGRATNGISHLRVIEDYAGVVYDGEPVEPDRFAVAVHREGRYTVEFVDHNDRLGAYRVTPDTFNEAFENIREDLVAGKATLVETLSGELGELRELSRTLSQFEGDDEVSAQIAHSDDEARAALTTAMRNDPVATNERLRNVIAALEAAAERLRADAQRAYDSAAAALAPRIRAAIERTETAIATELL